MILQVAVAMDIGNGIHVTQSSELLVDTVDEAQQGGNLFRELCEAFSSGYGTSE